VAGARVSVATLAMAEDFSGFSAVFGGIIISCIFGNSWTEKVR
jgi:hypothetical protein